MTKIKNIVLEAKANRINVFVEKTCLSPAQVAENVTHYEGKAFMGQVYQNPSLNMGVKELCFE